MKEIITPLHEGITVPDVTAAVEWYRTVFGFETVSDKVVPGLNARIVFMRLGEFELELFEYLGADKKPLPPERMTPDEDLKTAGVKHVAWRVENLEALYERLTELGVDIVAAPFPMEGDRVCFIRDCAGTLMELIEKGV